MEAERKGKFLQVACEGARDETRELETENEDCLPNNLLSLMNLVFGITAKSSA